MGKVFVIYNIFSFDVLDLVNILRSLTLFYKTV